MRTIWLILITAILFSSCTNKGNLYTNGSCKYWYIDSVVYDKVKSLKYRRFGFRLCSDSTTDRFRLNRKNLQIEEIMTRKDAQLSSIWYIRNTDTLSIIRGSYRVVKLSKDEMILSGDHDSTIIFVKELKKPIFSKDFVKPKYW